MQAFVRAHVCMQLAERTSLHQVRTSMRHANAYPHPHTHPHPIPHPHPRPHACTPHSAGGLVRLISRAEGQALAHYPCRSPRGRSTRVAPGRWDSCDARASAACSASAATPPCSPAGVTSAPPLRGLRGSPPSQQAAAFVVSRRDPSGCLSGEPPPPLLPLPCKGCRCCLSSAEGW